MNKQLIYELRNCPQALHDYYLDSGLNMYHEFLLNIGIHGIFTENTLVSEITIIKPYTFVEYLEELKLFPIQKINIAYMPLSHELSKCVSWCKEDHKNSYIGSILPSKLWNKLTKHKCCPTPDAKEYISIKLAKDDLSQTCMELLYE